MTIDDLMEKILPLSTGRFRFVLTMENTRFFSSPVSKDELLLRFKDMCDHPELTHLEYESKTEYTPGHYVWKVF